MTMPRWIQIGFWTLLSAPGVWHLGLLAWAVVARFSYPYDLEWMEGGVLHGAARIASGDGIYAAPSVDYISFLYTPLYPGVLAALGAVFGLSYQLGRMISILSLVGLAAVAIGNAVAFSPRHRGAAIAGALLGLGLFAAAYPMMEGWYDLVRGDTLFLLLATGGLVGLSRWARSGEGIVGHRKVALAGALLGLAFFAKQTGVIYAIAAGPVILVMNWRRAPTFVASVALVGLGGTALLQKTTGGWFWDYVYEIHHAHDWNKDRFYKSFDLILTHFRGATAILVVGLCVVLACAIVRRRLPPPARALLLWTYVYAVSTVVGALGWGTEFAHYNAFMPAFLHGAMAVGLVVPAVLACTGLLFGAESVDDRPVVTTARTIAATDRGHLIAHLATVVIVLGLGVQLYAARWSPRRFIPTARDRAAGDELIATIRALPGRVWVPSHPWYAHLAGKPMYVHRMGVKDVTARKPRPVLGLNEALRGHEFNAIVLDNRDLHLELPVIAQHYRPDDVIGRNAQPRLFTGAKIVPESIWVPAGPAVLPAGWRALFDFEDVSFAHWTIFGSAWGTGPVRKEVSGQGLVRRFGGRYFVTSMHGGDTRTGTLISAPFTIDADTIAMRLGGGADDPMLRVELRIEGKPVRTASPPNPPSERFADVRWAVGDLIGQTASIALVDDANGPWGHLNVDEIWIGPSPR